MEKSQIIGRVFVPAYEEAAEALHPRMNALHDPSACFELRFPLESLGFFPTLADMGGKAKFVKDVTDFLIVVALIQAHFLRMLLCWYWTVDDDIFNGAAHQLHIGSVGPFNRESDRHSMTFCQHTAFDSTLAAISRIGTRF